MKTTLLFSLLICLFVSSCRVDDDEPVAQSSEQTHREYKVCAGTYTTFKDNLFNPTGSIGYEHVDGSVILIKNEKVSLNLNVQYTMKGASGLFDESKSSSYTFKTDNNGDFIICIDNLNSRYPGYITKINSVKAVLTYVKGTVTYQKTFNYSNSTVWDIAQGYIGLFDLDVKEISSGKDNITVGRWIDIDSDIVLKMSAEQKRKLKLSMKSAQPLKGIERKISSESKK